MLKFNSKLFIAIAATLVLSCTKSTDSDCPKDRMCTEEFRSLTVSFTDNKGAPTAAKDYSAVLVRTGDTIKSKLNTVSNMVPGTFIAIDDSYTSKLSETGDEIKVSATSVQTKQTKSTVIKVSGGECACHIKKVSGAEKVAFD